MALATTHNFPDATPVEITHHRIESVVASHDHRAAAGWQVRGYVVMRITRGLRMNGDVAFVSQTVVAGSVDKPLGETEARERLREIATS